MVGLNLYVIPLQFSLDTLEEFNLFVGVEFLDFTEFCLARTGFDWCRAGRGNRRLFAVAADS